MTLLKLYHIETDLSPYFLIVFYNETQILLKMFDFEKMLQNKTQKKDPYIVQVGFLPYNQNGKKQRDKRNRLYSDTTDT